MPKATTATGGERPYHHGDLRRALLEAAIATIATTGPGAISLREVARRAGVSHAAPTHHFGDKAGLLTALAAEGFRLLANTLRDTYERTDSFLEVGVAYVRFATEHRAYFEVMFRPELYHANDPELVQASEAAEAMLYGPVGTMAGDAPDFDALTAGIAAWSLVHGLATLYTNNNLPPEVGHDPERIARAVASYLFRPPPRVSGP